LDKTRDLVKGQNDISGFCVELQGAFGTLITNGNAQNNVLNAIMEMVDSSIMEMVQPPPPKKKIIEFDEFNLNDHADYESD